MKKDWKTLPPPSPERAAMLVLKGLQAFSFMREHLIGKTAVHDPRIIVEKGLETFAILRERLKEIVACRMLEAKVSFCRTEN